VNWSLALRKDQTMKRKRHTEEQIIAILKEHAAGVKTADLCRKHGISEASFLTRPRPRTRPCLAELGELKESKLLCRGTSGPFLLVIM
jgi:hypothetical protein